MTRMNGYNLVSAIWMLLIAAQVQAGPIEDAVASKSRGDFAAALSQFKSLANTGNPRAQFELSLLYLTGKGVKSDTRQAMRWLKQSAVRGYQPAQSNLGVVFGRGRYLPQDEVKAYIWASIAATSGDAVAVTNRDVAGRNFSPKELEQVKLLAQECLRRFSEVQTLPQCL